MSTQANIIEFVSRVEAESNEHLVKQYPGENGYDARKKFSIKFGRKFAKIITHDSNGSGGGVWGFVEIESGTLLKAASWKAPAKHGRGNIETAAYGRNYVWTGPNYLR